MTLGTWTSRCQGPHHCHGATVGGWNHPSSSDGSDPRLCEPAVFVEGFRSRYFPLKQWLLRRGHQASSNITWERVRHSNSHCPLQDSPHQGLRAGPSDLCFCSTLKRESHCSPRTTSFPLPHSSLHQASIVTCTLHVRTSDPGVHQVAQGSEYS